uniref:Zgc:85932 n=1 Tax=Amphiprion percula TaxID=161767 RepID=A0A3P8TNU7_AMPPE
PQFIVDGATRLDICQGKLNDCWLLSAIASLSVHRSLLKKVVPLEQNFQDGYNGSFTFRFWQYGQWEEVRIDDLLPTQNNNLIYLSSPEKHEFWSSLLEKAYAKLKGGYRALDMGFPHEAMVDMTGGVTEVLKVLSLPRDLPAFLRNLLAKGALINCANTQGPLEQQSELGIMYRHAYSLTAVEKVKTAHGIVDLVRIMNPWGNTEWQGPWSDLKGPEWNTVSVEEQQRLGRVRREDGEFWMSVSDFRQHFEMMEVCHLTETLSRSGCSVSPWCCIIHHGSWVPNITNPQFYFILSEVDSCPERSKKTCSFVLALMQKFQRRRGIDLAIALHNTYLSPNDLRACPPILCSPQYSSRREVVLRGSLPPGRYVIVPSTSEPNQQGDFLLRVLTERVLAGSEKYLALEHCKSLVVLMDLVGLRYTEPDMTISYPGFLYLLMKLESMIHKFQAYDMVGMGTVTISYRQVGSSLHFAHRREIIKERSFSSNMTSGEL